MTMTNQRPASDTPTFAFIQATEDHARELASRLREIAYESIRDGSGKDPLNMLLDGLDNSDRVSALIGPEGQLLGILGVAPAGSTEIGCFWMLTAADQDHGDQSEMITAAARVWVEEYASTAYPILWSMMDQRDALLGVMRWFDLGFVCVDLIPDWGCGKKPFYSFARFRNV